MAIFEINYNTAKRGLPTLFKHRYFTVDASQRKTWDYEHLDQYLQTYKLCIDEKLMAQYSEDKTVSMILKDLKDSESEFAVSRNEADRYIGENQYIKCRISVFVLQHLKTLFVSTLVYADAKLQMPVEESVNFLFNTEAKTVTITSLTLYQPLDDPFFTYARNAAASLSVKAIGLETYSIDKSDDVKDFYDRTMMSGWKERKQLQQESSIIDKPGIYMLYDTNANTYYVGKAIRLQERIQQHANNQSLNEPIPNFTHYRYSVISGEYYEFLYLIENAAIHDAAWLLDMPNAKKYKPCLVKKLKEVDLNNCKIVNRLEHQTRKQ